MFSPPEDNTSAEEWEAEEVKELEEDKETEESYTLRNFRRNARLFVGRGFRRDMESLAPTRL